MELFFLCGFSLFLLFISLSLVSLFFIPKCSNASLPPPLPTYHLSGGFQIQGAQVPVEGAFVETIDGSNIPNAWKYYGDANSRHKISGCMLFPPGRENLDPSASGYEGKECARMEMRVFMHKSSTLRISSI